MTYTATICTDETFTLDYYTRAGGLRTATYIVTEADGDTVRARVRMGGAWYVATIERTEAGITFSRTRENGRGSSPYAWKDEITDTMTEVFGALFESDDEVEADEVETDWSALDVADDLRAIEVAAFEGRTTKAAYLAAKRAVETSPSKPRRVRVYRTHSRPRRWMASVETSVGNHIVAA